MYPNVGKANYSTSVSSSSSKVGFSRVLSCVCEFLKVFRSLQHMITYSATSYLTDFHRFHKEVLETLYRE